MCMKCEIKKLMSDLVGIDTKETLIGKVPAGLILLLQLAENDLNKIKADSRAKTIEMVISGKPKEEIMKALNDSYKELFEKAAAAVDKSWENIYESVGLDASVSHDYRIDVVSGELFRKEEVVKEKAPQAPGVH